MDKIAPLFTSFLDQQARPQVQAKVTEQLNSTKGDLKHDLPTTILNYLSGKDGNEGASSNPMVSQLVSTLGPNLLKSITSVTDSTVDTASEGMDTLLTNGIMNIAKSVLTQSATNANGGPAETGGINFDFLRSGKEGMVSTTMAASEPVIKQVSENMSAKLSSAIPGAIGNTLQSMMGQQAGGSGGPGGSGGALGMAAGLMSTLMHHGNGTAPTDSAATAGGAAAPNAGAAPDAGGAAPVAGGNGPIQQLCQNMLGPKIALLLKPYLAKFETQMVKCSSFFFNLEHCFPFNFHKDLQNTKRFFLTQRFVLFFSILLIIDPYSRKGAPRKGLLVRIHKVDGHGYAHRRWSGWYRKWSFWRCYECYDGWAR